MSQPTRHASQCAQECALAQPPPSSRGPGVTQQAVERGKLPQLDPAREVFIPFPIEDAEHQFPCLVGHGRGSGQ